MRFASRLRLRFRTLVAHFAWNGLLVVAGAALIAASAEAYMRATGRFTESRWSSRLVPGLGPLYDPNTEVRATNGLDYWTVSRTNSLGFADREPPSPRRAAASCHVVVIGDSFVDAREVPTADKLQVRLEELAGSTLPHMGVTVSAFGYMATGQVQQLAYYDEYARHLHPRLVVLVFVPNDFVNNYPVFRALRTADDPEQLRDRSVARMPNGEMKLRPPTADSGRRRLVRSDAPSRSWLGRVVAPVERASVFASWLGAKKSVLLPSGRGLSGHVAPGFAERVEAMSKDPRYAGLFDGWSPDIWEDIETVFAQDDLPPPFEDALEYTAFALEQFKARTDRDGTRLVVLASHGVRQRGGRLFERTSQVAAAVDVPVVDQADYILRQGAELADAHWAHDGHWNVKGHRWAAEALLEYIGEHQNICDGS